MAPTPIKVKGKGPRKKAWAPPDPTKLKRRHDGDADDDALARRLARRRKPALIEKLPTEILERIFFLSQNINFPRSSLRIGKIFSHPSALVQLTVEAFAPRWKLAFGCQEGCKTPSWLPAYVGCKTCRKLLFGDYGKKPGSRAFETAVLACPWMTIEILDNAQQVFKRRYKSFELRQKIEGPESYTLGEGLDRDLDALPKEEGVNSNTDAL
ncbi:hypothetical protein V8F33_011733 [Rhypophila sp. PSN 637]